MKVLANAPKVDREHFMECEICGSYFDMRDLGQVFQHEHKNINNTLKQPASRKKGSSVVWLKDKKSFMN